MEVTASVSVSNHQFTAESSGTGATQIYLVPGTKATLTDFITVGATIVVPIIQDVSQKIWQPIIGWAAFKVDSLSSNSMTGHFVPNYFLPMLAQMHVLIVTPIYFGHAKISRSVMRGSHRRYPQYPQPSPDSQLSSWKFPDSAQVPPSKAELWLPSPLCGP